MKNDKHLDASCLRVCVRVQELGRHNFLAVYHVNPMYKFSMFFFGMTFTNSNKNTSWFTTKIHKKTSK